MIDRDFCLNPFSQRSSCSIDINKIIIIADNYFDEQCMSRSTTDLPHPYNKIGDGPEGPEARTVADKLRPVLLNNVIIKAHKAERGKSIGFENIRCPANIIGVRSYGKKVLIDIENNKGVHMIIVSLGMSGRLQYSPGNHSHIMFEIAQYNMSGPLKIMRPLLGLYFDDTRYMGGIDIIPTAGLSLYFKDLGPDLLHLALDEKTWIPLETWMLIFCQKKLMKRAICDVLLDQSLVAGIGNYLSSEILYYSGVLPDRSVESITMQEWDHIRISAHKVIHLSYSYGGFTIESFISPDGTLGTYPAAVYHKKFDPSGNPVISGKTRNRRTSHWVPSIQH